MYVSSLLPASTASADPEGDSGFGLPSGVGLAAAAVRLSFPAAAEFVAGVFCDGWTRQPPQTRGASTNARKSFPSDIKNLPRL
ncbi:MAG TPA: hypothetical protein VF521_06310, partial [Pyrinomonadaceae bacterium]